MSIVELLSRSRQRHTDAKRARREARIDDHVQAITDAQALRQQAHESDPEHLDQAWEQDAALKFDHATILAFYADELAKDRTRERQIAKSRLDKGLRVVAASLPAGGVQ